MGRPTSYKPEYAELAFRYALLGMTNEEMAVSFDVSGATLANWANEFPEFLDARARGRDEADGAVVASLYKRALGGDTQAATWWLKNRRPKQWADKQQIDMTMNDDITARLVEARKRVLAAAADRPQNDG